MRRRRGEKGKGRRGIEVRPEVHGTLAMGGMRSH